MTRPARSAPAGRPPPGAPPLGQERPGRLKASRPQLVVPRMGIALIALGLAAWLTGLPYLLVRLGPALPVPLVRFDGPHIYLGLAMAALLLLKMTEIRVRHLLRSLPGFLLWHHWLSLALLALWGLVLATGLLILLPWPAPLRQDLVEVHLFGSVWAAVATLPHAVIYLRRRLPGAQLDRRLVGAMLVMLLPAAALLLVPRAAAPFSQLDAGQPWTPVHDGYSYRLEELPDGRILATGAGLWISHDAGFHWQSVPGLATQFVYQVSAGPGGAPAYAGTTGGLYAAPDAAGPYRPFGLQSRQIDSVFVDPEAPNTIWAGGQGVWRSTDGGVTWTTPVEGLMQRGSVFLIGRYNGALYAGASTGLYRWDGASWDRVLDRSTIISLDYGDDHQTLWASSMGGGLYTERRGRWIKSDAGMLVHEHAGGPSGVHVDGFLALDGGRALAATMTRGVAESLDAGSSWYSPSPGFRPGGVWDLIRVGDHVLVATDSGVFSGRFPRTPSPGVAWWLLLVGMTVLAVAVGSLLGLASGPESARRG